MLFDILLIVILIILLLSIVVTWNYDYWKKRNVPYVKPAFPFGCFNKTFLARETLSEQLSTYYDLYDGYKYFGIYIFRKPFLFIRDPDLMKAILIKNFNNFNNNIFLINEHTNPLAANNPFVLKDARWKLVRSQLTPALSPGKIKHMFPNMVEVTKRLVEYLTENPDLRKGVKMKDLALCFTTENVALCGLGINAKSFENDPGNLKNITANIFKQNESLTTLLKMILFSTDPQLNYLMRTKILSTNAANFITNLVKDALKHRRSNNVQANDYLDHLRQVQDKCKEYDFNDTHIIAQFTTLFFDGVDTSALVLSILLYEIAARPEIFKKLRREIDSKLKGEINYETIAEMPILDSCFNENLRKNTALIFQAKECTEPFTLPSPHDGYPELTVEKGTFILIPSYLTHHDPKYHPNPYSFMPERFYDDEKKEKINVDMFYPFGDGPRICLGRNFATAQIKAAVTAIVKNFDVTVNNKTNVPLKPTSPTFLNLPSDEIYLDFYERGEIYRE